MRHTTFRYLAIPATVLVATLALSCSNNTKAAPTRAEVTMEPGVYEADHPELFPLAAKIRR